MWRRHTAMLMAILNWALMHVRGESILYLTGTFLAWMEASYDR